MATALTKTTVAARKVISYYPTLNNVRVLAVNIRSFSSFENSDENETTLHNTVKEGKLIGMFYEFLHSVLLASCISVVFVSILVWNLYSVSLDFQHLPVF